MPAFDDYQQTVSLMTDLLSGLAPADLQRPTPCAAWSVGDLVGHLLDNTAFFAGAVGVGPAGVSGEHADVEVTAADAAAAFAAVATVVLDGYGTPGVLDRDVETPYGTFPGEVVLAVCFADLLTHCWDLARSLGTDIAVDDELAEHGMEAWQIFIQDDYRESGMFGAVQPCPAGAPALDRMAAFAGRPVTLAS